MIGALSAFCSSCTWAVGSARYSVLSRKYDPFSVNFGRAAFALPLFLLANFVLAGGWGAGLAEFSGVTPSIVGWFALSMFCSYGFGDVVFLLSTQAIGVPTALAIASFYPVWTALAAWGVRGESLQWGQWGGLLLAVAGIMGVILMSPGSKGGRLNLKGVLLAVLTSVFWAINSFAVAQAGRNLGVPVSNSIRMVFGLIFSFSLGTLFLKRTVRLPWREYRSSSWLFAMEAFGGSFFYTYGLTHSPLAVGATLTSLAPVISVPVTTLMGLEKLSWARTLAIFLVVCGISLLLQFRV